MDFHQFVTAWNCKGVRTHRVGLLVHCLHHHHVSALVDRADRRLQLHLLSQVFGHALADLAGATRKFPLLQQRIEREKGSVKRTARGRHSKSTWTTTVFLSSMHKTTYFLSLERPPSHLRSYRVFQKKPKSMFRKGNLLVSQMFCIIIPNLPPSLQYKFVFVQLRPVSAEWWRETRGVERD